jgi:RPA family protein
MVDKKRLTAVKTRIKDVANGKFVAQEGLEPNYIIAPNGMRISRGRILATVVDKFMSEDKKFSSVTLDDGTETIRAKAFNSFILDALENGDIIDIIGRIKNYQEETYLVPEIIFRVENPNFEILRELEIKDIQKVWSKKREIVMNYQKQVSDIAELKSLAKEFNISQEEVESILQSQEEPQGDAGSNVKERILEMIDKNDAGDGCDYSTLMEQSGLTENELDSVVEELLDDGSCFEPRPGKIKKL